jgi:uncharacterized repeat protein (TIGR01451 family)
MKKYYSYRILSALLILSCLAVFFQAQPIAALPAGYQEFYLPNVDNYAVFYGVDNTLSTSNKNMHFVVGVTAAADNTTVYYDHWENGLGSGTTNDETVALNKGQVYIFESSNIPTPRGTTTKYDGGDRIYVSGSLLQLVVSAWPESIGTVFADAWEVYPVQAWQNTYTIPAGEALFSSYPNFHSVYALVLSGSDSNSISITNAAGTVQASTTLNRGQTYVYEITGGAGYTITGSGKIEVQMITGNNDNHWEMRGYTITPSQYWGSGYYTPVPSWTSSSKSELFLYNPNSSSITISWEDRSGSGGSLTTGTFSIAAKTTRSYSNGTGHYIPIGSGAYVFTANNALFWGIGAGDIGTDGNSAAWDWGYSLIPINFLGNDNYVSWAPGNRTMAGNTVNGSPVYVTALNNNTTVAVDYGPNNGVFDYTTTINRLQAVKIFDPDKDNTGMHIVSSGPVAVAWGEDPRTAGTGDPYLDMGYTTLPLPVTWIDVALNVAKTANPTAVSAGNTSEFTIVVSVPSSAGAAVTSIVLQDTLPIGWTYQSGSTKIDGSAAADPAITGAISSGYNLTWNAGWSISAGNSHTVTFKASPDGTAPNPSRNVAKASGVSAGINLTAEGDAYVSIIPVSINPAVDISKSGPASYQAGDTITYTISVRNTGDTILLFDGFTDSLTGTPAVPLALQTLDVGETGSFTYTYTVPPGAPDPLVNTATIHYHPSGYATLDINDTAVANTFKQNPAIGISKSANPTALSAPGTITYTYTVTNTGNVTLNAVTVVDNQTGTISLASSSLAPGASTSGTATFHVDQTIFDSGSRTNSATASGTPAGGSAVTATDNRTVTFTPLPSINIVKSFAWTRGNGSRVGDNVTYTYTVTNTGNVTLNPVTVVDNVTGPISLGSTILAPGAFTTGTATVTIQEPDLDAGSWTNIATATGKPPFSPNVTAQDTRTVDFIQISEIEIVKTFAWTQGNGSQVGDNVTYTYTVTNKGNSDLFNITVNDDKLGPISIWPATELEPGESAVGTATLRLTQELLNSGSESNTATASGETPSHSEVTAQDNETVNFIRISDINLVKDFVWTFGDGSHAGDNGTYIYRVTNTGNTDLHNITLYDDKSGVVTVSPSAVLGPGENATGTALLTVTTAMIDNETLTNTATVTGLDPGGLPVSAQDSHLLHFKLGPSLEIVKSFAWSNGNGAHVGDNVTYTYLVTNSGNVPLNSITVVDDKLGIIHLGSTSLAAGDNTTGTAVLTLTEPDLDAGSQTNTALAAGQTSGHIWVTAQDNQTVNFIQISNIEIVKTFNWIAGNGSSAGDVGNFSYRVTNTGNTDLYNITVNDDILGPIVMSPAAELEPGENATGSATLIVTQAMLNAGSQTNIGTAEGATPGGGTVTSQDSRTIYFQQNPDLSILKTFDWTRGNGAHVGDNVTYTYIVTNTGNVSLDNLTVNDNKLGSISLSVSSLAPGESTSGRATLTLTQGNLDSGLETNTATASGQPLNGPAVSAQDTRTVTFIANPAIDILKTYAWTNGNGAHVGDNVTYSYLVTNSGNVTLDNITLNDDKQGTISLPVSSLAPGAFTSGIFVFTITEPDIDLGSLTNIATVSGETEAHFEVTAQDSQTVNFIQIPEIQVVKSALWTPGDPLVAGDNITYNYSVTNIGNCDLDNITVIDDRLGPITVAPAEELEPGDQATGLADYTLTQADIDNGTLTNLAVASGISPRALTVVDSDSLTLTLSQTPNIHIDKTFSWTKGNGSSVGDVVTYHYTVTNSGTTSLYNINISDNKLGEVTVYPSARLGPGDNATGTATMVVTQAMIDNGTLTNTAVAFGETLQGDPVSGLDSRTITLTQNPAINIVKSDAWTKGNGSQVGDNLTYTFKITNTGNVTLDNITVYDDKLGAITLSQSSLGPGDNVTGMATLTLDQNLIDNGTETNIVSASGDPPEGPAVTAMDSRTVDFIAYPSIDIQKTYAWTTGNGAHPGDNVTYTYTVTNSGNVTLDNITLYDDKLGSISLGSTNLAPGDNITGSAVLTLTELDLDAGSQTNTATASGLPPSGPAVTDQETRTVQFIQVSNIQIDKSFQWTTGNGSQVGDNLTYTYRVTNAGNSDLYNITVYDDKLGAIPVSPSADLEPGENATGTASLTVTQEMLDGGSLTNIATAAGVTPQGSAVHSSDSRTVDFIAVPALNVSKSFSWLNSDGSKVGDNGTFVYLVTNTGNVTLDPVTVIDDKLGAITLFPVSKLAPGEFAMGTAILNVTQAMIDNSTETNTATASGTPPSGPAVTSQDSQTIDFLTGPAINVDKTALWTHGNGSQVGDNITYAYLVTNTGNTNLFNISLNDDQLGPISLGFNFLAPGAFTAGTATYTIRETDLDNGTRTNIATVRGETLDETVVTGQDNLTVTLIQRSDMQLVKTFAWTLGNGSQVDDNVTYTYTLTNTGNTDLDNITVNDDKLGTIEMSGSSLEPGENVTGTATHTITELEIDAGSLTNTAIATGDTPGGSSLTAQDNQTVTLIQISAIQITKSFEWTAGDGSQVGDVVTYSYDVINTGNSDLYDISVNDDVLGNVTISPSALLEPGETVSGTKTMEVTQAMLDAGLVINTATAAGLTPSETTVYGTDSRTVRFKQAPALEVVKTYEWTTGDGFSVGDNVTYTYTVTNTGNINLSGITVQDDRLGEINLGSATLAPGDNTTGTMTLTVTQDMLDGGEPIYNLAAANSDQGATATADATVILIQNAAFEVVKSGVMDMTVVAPDTQVDPGDQINYTIRVTNTGNITLTEVTLDDPLLGALSGPQGDNNTNGRLEINESWVYTGSYTVTQADIDNNGNVTPADGMIHNTVSVVTQETDPLTASAEVVMILGPGPSEGPAMEVTKIANLASVDQAGEVIDYTVTVTNTGTVALDNVTLMDTLLDALSGPSGDNNTNSLLDTDETWVYTGSYTVTQADIDNLGNIESGGGEGNIHNTVSVWSDEIPEPLTASANVAVEQNPALWLVKDGEVDTTVVYPPFQANPGDLINYTISVTNTGNTTLTEVTVNDPLLGVLNGPFGDANNNGLLDIGETWVYTATYTIKPGDIAAGKVINNAQVLAAPPSGEPIDETVQARTTLIFSSGVGGEVKAINPADLLTRWLGQVWARLVENLK